MPISIVVGGQYGSEGKGKVALALKREHQDVAFVARPGGTNSGHTVVDQRGQTLMLRQFPAAAADRDTRVIFPAGSYIDPDIFLRELELLSLPASNVSIDRRAHVILPEHQTYERQHGLVESIGSTGSGTGAAVLSRAARFAHGFPNGLSVEEHPILGQFTGPVPELLSDALVNKRRVLIEGTQGFGLSVLHGNSWPKCTARDTTAAGFLSEVGLPPSLVDEVVLVIRSFPIRVAGDSGPLKDETTWEEVSQQSGRHEVLQEFTSVTRRVRRVGHFDPALVRQAVNANWPTKIVLNHLDYIDSTIYAGTMLSEKAETFVRELETAIGRNIDFVGTGPDSLVRVRGELVEQ